MKKFGKFIFATVSLAAAAGGAYYFIKNVINKDSSDEFDDFDDEFDDFDDDEEEPKTTAKINHDRGYVTLNLNSEEVSDEGTEAAGEDIAEEDASISDGLEGLKEAASAVVEEAKEELKDVAEDVKDALDEADNL